MTQLELDQAVRAGEPMKTPSTRRSGASDRVRPRIGKFTWAIIAFSVAALLSLVIAPERDFPGWRLNLGSSFESAFNFATTHWSAFFAFIDESLSSGFESLSATIGAISAPVLVLGVFLFLLYKRGIPLALLSLATVAWVVGSGLWSETVDTAAFMVVAVICSAVAGILIGILASTNDRVDAAVRVVLDAMQAYPSFGYLVPVVAILGTGNAGALIVTMVFSIPPIARMTALGLRNVPQEVIEAADSVGSTKFQQLWQVKIPMARGSIAAGLNQTIMFAISMATMSAIIGGSGLGEPVWNGLSRLEFGSALAAGIGLVLIAIILDRSTAPSKANGPRRRWVTGSFIGVFVLGAAIIPMLVPPALQDFSRPPTWLQFTLRGPVNAAIEWLNLNIGVQLEWLKDNTQIHLLTPLTDGLSWIPWPAMVLIGVTLGLLARSVRIAVIAGVGIFAIGLLGMWEPTAATVAIVGAATVLSIVIGFPIGVMMARSQTVYRVMRPVLDVVQTMPVFLWIIPAVMVLGTGGVPGLLATLLYAVTPVIRYTYVALSETDGEVIDASTSLGSTEWQQLWHVRVPLGLKTILIGINQCILLSLAMATVSAFIGTPGLGQEIIASVTFAQIPRGIDAGTAMLILAVISDRLVVAYAGRVGASPTRA